MTRNSFRNFLCAATMALLGTFGTGAQATFYDLGWDPAFEGIVRIDLDPACIDLSSMCLVKAISGDFFDSLGDHWGIVSESVGTLDPVIISGGVLVALDATFGTFLLEGEAGCEVGTLHFFLQQGVTFSCGSIHDSATSYTVTAVAVPEPATLALLGLGLAIAGLAGSRRRKPH